MAIQRRSVCLADAYRYFIYLGSEMQKLRDQLPGPLYIHCIRAFNKRYHDVCHPLCHHLALFLITGDNPFLESWLLTQSGMEVQKRDKLPEKEFLLSIVLLRMQNPCPRF